MFEKSKWISRDFATDMRPAPFFRKNFIVNKDVTKVMLNICGLGTGEYYLNGEKVTDEVLITPVTKYDSKIIYSSFEITQLVKMGTNVLSAVLGNSWYNTPTHNEWNFDSAAWRDCPKLICQLDITYSDGTEEQIVSDSTWKTADSPIIYNELRFGVHYDARLEIPDWNSEKLDDSDWDNAIVSRPPGGVISDLDYTPIKVIDTINPKNVKNRVYDFGVNLSGWVKITLTAKKGAKIKIRYSERIHDDGSVNQLNVNFFIYGEDGHTDIYIAKGDGVESFEQQLIYHGFRYVQIDGDCEVCEVVAKLVHADLKIVGDFSSSDELLNWIHTAERRSTLTNYMSFPTDCPHREQNGWTGDGSVSSDQCLYNYDMVRAYMKWLDDIKDTQRPTGQIASIAPTSNYGYGFGGGPAWDSALILIPYNIYLYTGSICAIEKYWDAMELYMGYIESMSENYIVGFGLWDWAAPCKDNEWCPVNITDTGYYYKFSCVMAECCRLLNRDSSKYDELSANIKKSFRSKFMKDGKMIHDTQTAVACAMYQGLFEEDEKPEAAKRLAELVIQKDYHIDCGILGTKYIFDSLSEYGYGDVLYKMISNPTCPSYAFWKNSGMTTLGELWDLTIVAHTSDNHHMFGEVETWLFKHIAGIRPLKPGFEEVLIKPTFLENIDWVKANHNGVSVEYDKEKINIVTDVPGVLELPSGKYTFDKGRHTFNINY